MGVCHFDSLVGLLCGERTRGVRWQYTELLLISETMLITLSSFGSAPEILARHVVHARVSLFKY